jgi:hypothetical protein
MIYDAYKAQIKRTHPEANIGIDELHEFAGARIIFYRSETSRYVHHRIAVMQFDQVVGVWRIENDVIVKQD